MLLQVLALGIGSYLLLIAVLAVFQRSLLYHPDGTAPDPGASGVGEMAAVTARNSDNAALTSWYASGDPDRPVVVYLHGNAGNIGSRGHKARPFLDAGYGVLLVGYRGYGGNPGKPTEQGLYDDARAALGWLEEEEGRGRPLVLYGESLGTGVATVLAAERARGGTPVQALILEAPFPSITAAARHHYPYVPVKWLLRDRFDQAAVIGDVDAPVLVLHGERDQTMPVRFGKALFERADGPKVGKWYEEAGHNDLFDFGADSHSIQFIEQHVPANP